MLRNRRDTTWWKEEHNVESFSRWLGKEMIWCVKDSIVNNTSFFFFIFFNTCKKSLAGTSVPRHRHNGFSIHLPFDVSVLIYKKVFIGRLVIP